MRSSLTRAWPLAYLPHRFFACASRARRADGPLHPRPWTRTVDDVNRVMADRMRKLASLREEGIDPFANDFRPTATCSEVLDAAAEGNLPDMGDIRDDAAVYGVAGRVMARNVMGKAMFLRIRDRSVGQSPDDRQTLQLYARRDAVGEDTYRLLKSLDVGDFIGVTGPLFSTRTEEPTIYLRSGKLLTKSLRPLPEKFHGLSDVETRYRQRYLDLVMNTEVKAVFRTRSQIIEHLRRFLADRDYVEVETPMMHVIPGGATARPFETHHNALDIPLFLRIAPELYLKRLVVGGFERVFELNRNFRNEGLSPRHNPEFTMLEFYQAYATYEDLIDLTEEMLSSLVTTLNGDGSTTRPYGDATIDYGRPFRRMTLRQSLVDVAGLSADEAGTPDGLRARLAAEGDEGTDGLSYGHLLMRAFDVLVEGHLEQPTFITEFPVEVSPLARRGADDPAYTDRFELFVAGHEIANAFSELNDPVDQRERFEAQAAARDAGDQEAMYMDLDYVRALEVGMPPAAGEGIGIDRLVMLLTDKHTIREVILFPHMRPE